MSARHSEQTDVHVPFSWTYADATARLAATGFVADDIGKLCRQVTPPALYMLTATTPTWLLVVGAVVDTLRFDVPGALVQASGTTRLYLSRSCTITNVAAMVGVAPTGANVIVDVHYDGATIFTAQGNRPEIAASAFTDLANAPDVTALVAGHYLTLDVDQIGSSIAGSNLIVLIEVTVP